MERSKNVLVVYMHGIGNQPPANSLKKDWDRALFGSDMGERSRMAYWSDIRYPRPMHPTEFKTASMNDMPMHTMSKEEYLSRAEELTPYGAESEQFIRKVAAQLLAGHERQGVVGAKDVTGKVLPLPTPLRDASTWFLTKLFLKDVAAYFYDEAQREEIESRLQSILMNALGPFVLVTHSLGTLIAYDVMRRDTDSNFKVPLFLTLGSPLGIQEVQDQISRLWPDRPLKRPSMTEKWLNFADRLDIVAIDPTLKDDFGNDKNIHDLEVENSNRWSLTEFGPHSGTGYLSLATVREPVKDTLRTVGGDRMLEALSDHFIARDIAADMSIPGQPRLEVLIELYDKQDHLTLDQRKEKVVNTLEEIVGRNRHDADIDDGMKRYVSAHLTAVELDRLKSAMTYSSAEGQLTVSKIWKNSTKRALVDESSKTVHAETARRGYDASGNGIHWAVLDSGIEAEHPHFQSFDTISQQWDCTLRGDPRPSDNLHDTNGHGTHVAGIIAGYGVEKGETRQSKHSDENPRPVSDSDVRPRAGSSRSDESRSGKEYWGVAPQTKIHMYKVLADDGSGKDGWIIKALDHIGSVNEHAGRLIIHGVNLSLGGPFDPEVFGCGHSPLCKELRRLWRQGVIVCVAAGNEGYLELNGAFNADSLNIDLSISDPANLDECLAVGSVHKASPHFFGVSYFSSRGPTADGRMKPDLVAPGERIYSCSNNYLKTDNYVAMSGTSMATPVVSGVVAAFLSVRREFVGYPDRVKEILLANCTDLKRDRYHQGAGLPNVVKMLLNT